MITSHRRLRLAAAAGALALIAGCSTWPFAPRMSPEEAAARKDLDAGVELYNAGDYNGAIKQLGGSATIWKAGKPVQLDALKYMAFSYCVTNRQSLCKQQFEKALKLDPSFDLAPGEKGHPLWEPVFDKVKKGSR
jgi:Tfp pilus assembly protein PilF